MNSMKDFMLGGHLSWAGHRLWAGLPQSRKGTGRTEGHEELQLQLLIGCCGSSGWEGNSNPNCFLVGVARETLRRDANQGRCRCRWSAVLHVLPFFLFLPSRLL